MPATTTYAQRRTEAETAIKALRAAASSENRRQSADELDAIEGHLAAIDQANADESADRANATREAEVLARADKASADLGKSRGRRTAPAAVAPEGSVTAREGWIDDPTRGYKTPRALLMDVLAAGIGARPVMPDHLESMRAPMQATAGSDEQGGYSDPYGGYLIPKVWTPGVEMVAAEADPIAAYVRRVPMSGPKVSFNARVDKTHTSSVSGGLRVYRRAEADTSSSSRMVFQQIDLIATGLFGVAYATEEILTDSPVSFVSLLGDGFRDEFGAVILNERLRGTGAGEFMGVLNSPCKVEVSKETGQAAATIVYQNIIKMYARLWGKNNGVWLANHNTLPQLCQLTQDVGTGGVPVWQPSAREGTPATLLGLPIFFSEFPATLGTVGDLILGNWSQYLEGTLEPLSSGESIHVRFVNHERTFKFWMRNAGQPWWSTALTPKNGDTLSPFVTLATRA